MPIYFICHLGQLSSYLGGNIILVTVKVFSLNRPTGRKTSYVSHPARGGGRTRGGGRLEAVDALEAVNASGHLATEQEEIRLCWIALHKKNCSVRRSAPNAMEEPTKRLNTYSCHQIIQRFATASTFIQEMVLLRLLTQRSFRTLSWLTWS